MRKYNFKIKNIICLILLVATIIYVPLVSINKVRSRTEYLKPQGYKGIIKLWNIDTFEGGKGSRGDFLFKRAVEFENINKGIIFDVRNLKIAEAESLIGKNEKPDMIVSGREGIALFDNYCELKAKNVREDLLKAGSIKGKVYAVPYLFGAYCFISHRDIASEDYESIFRKTVISRQENSYPLLAVPSLNFKVNEKGTTENYVDFLNNKERILLGTQRDVFRLLTREKEFYLKAFYPYTDLINFIGVLEIDRDKYIYAQKFIDFLLESKTQKKLKDIGLFSVTKERIYDSESPLSILENSMINKVRTISVFLDKGKIRELRENYIGLLDGNVKCFDKNREYLL